MKEIKAFNDRDFYEEPQEAENTKKTKDEVFEKIEIGSGSKTMKADERGLWLGDEDPQNAKFYVDMNGNIYLKDGQLKFTDDDGNVTILIGNDNNADNA